MVFTGQRLVTCKIDYQLKATRQRHSGKVNWNVGCELNSTFSLYDQIYDFPRVTASGSNGDEVRLKQTRE